MTTPVQTKCSIHVTTRIYIFIISHIKSVQTSQMLAAAKHKRYQHKFMFGIRHEKLIFIFHDSSTTLKLLTFVKFVRNCMNFKSFANQEGSEGE